MNVLLFGASLLITQSKTFLHNRAQPYFMLTLLQLWLLGLSSNSMRFNYMSPCKGTIG